MNTHPMYVCDTCKFAQYHPMGYCPKCPGKLHRRDVPHPEVLVSEAHRVAILDKEGIEYVGEYPDVPKERQLEIAIIRAQQYLDAATADAEKADREGDEAQATRLRKLAASWTNRINKLRSGEAKP